MPNKPTHDGRDKPFLNIALKFFVSGIVALVLAGGIVVGHTLERAETNHAAQIERCESGNDLKQGLIDYFTGLRDKAQHPDPELLKKFNITAMEAKELVKPEVEALTYDINVRFAKSDCEEEIP